MRRRHLANGGYDVVRYLYNERNATEAVFPGTNVRPVYNLGVTVKYLRSGGLKYLILLCTNGQPFCRR